MRRRAGVTEDRTRRCGRTPFVGWALPWPCLHEFLAIVTHSRIYSPPTPLARALDQIEAWLESPSVVLLAEEHTYWATLRPLVIAGRATGPLVHDARVAALCRLHGVSELWTADRSKGFPWELGGWKSTRQLLT